MAASRGALAERVIPAGGEAEEPGSSAMLSGRTRSPNDPGYGLRPFRDDAAWRRDGAGGRVMNMRGVR